jgi:tetratricopeptide (TPR) repeat protein
MPLVAAKCTQCGGNLQVDPVQEAAICEFCHSPFIVEKATNNYNTTVNIYEQAGITADSLIARADTLLQDGDFAKADEYYDRALERAPTLFSN